MNLGIERSRMGDILIDGQRAIVFVKPEIADFIADNLTRIRHTTVQTKIQEPGDISYEPKYQQIKGTVPSVRLDTILSVAYPLSRSKLTAYIQAGKVFVNGKLITSNGCHLKEGDFISVRGLGRIMYEETIAATKKGRYMVTVRKYI